MEFLSFTHIILIPLFFVPGFIYMKARRCFIADDKTNFSKDLYEAIGYSFINALIIFYPIFLISNSIFSYFSLLNYALLFFAIILSPIIGAYLSYKFSSSKWYRNHFIEPNKSTWDNFFSMRESYWVIITLKNGEKIAGKYGVNSFASTYPLPEEIYIEDVWKLNESNNKFQHKIDMNKGVLITKDEISYINFYK